MCPGVAHPDLSLSLSLTLWVPERRVGRNPSRSAPTRSPSRLPSLEGAAGPSPRGVGRGSAPASPGGLLPPNGPASRRLPPRLSSPLLAPDSAAAVRPDLSPAAVRSASDGGTGIRGSSAAGPRRLSVCLRGVAAAGPASLPGLDSIRSAEWGSRAPAEIRPSTAAGSPAAAARSPRLRLLRAGGRSDRPCGAPGLPGPPTLRYARAAGVSCLRGSLLPPARRLRPPRESSLSREREVGSRGDGRVSTEIRPSEATQSPRPPPARPPRRAPGRRSVVEIPTVRIDRLPRPPTLRHTPAAGVQRGYPTPAPAASLRPGKPAVASRRVRVKSPGTLRRAVAPGATSGSDGGSPPSTGRRVTGSCAARHRVRRRVTELPCSLRGPRPRCRPGGKRLRPDTSSHPTARGYRRRAQRQTRGTAPDRLVSPPERARGPSFPVDRGGPSAGAR